MRQFAEQVRQVGILYRSYNGGWRWFVPFLFFLLIWIFGQQLGRPTDDDERATDWMLFLFSNTSLAGMLYEQIRRQFIHPRAKLIPNFNSAHWTVPAIICASTGLLIPAALSWWTGSPLLPLCTISSLVFAISLFSIAYPNAFWLIFVGYIVPSIFGYDFWGIQFLKSPTICALVLFTTYGTLIYCGYVIARLQEDDDSYRRALGKMSRVPGDGLKDQSRAEFQRWSSRCGLSDRWNSKIGGFHQFRMLRIIRLLRYGFGATPVELTAIVWAIPMTILVGMLVDATDGEYDITRSASSAIFLIGPALFASIPPIAVAGGAIGLRVPRLKNEILFPLTRRELIDDLLLASAWYSFLFWLLGCVFGTGILLYALPAESKTVSLFATAALLAAAVAVAAYGLSLHIVMWEKFSQYFMLGLFVLGVVFLMCAWWSSRVDIGDAPYWVVSAIVLGVGAMMTHTGRTVWLNQEFG